MKVTIVFHSVCGNTYLIAKAFGEDFARQGATVTLVRTADADWVEKPDLSEAAKANVAAMRALPEAKPADLESADLILLGSPTYFGNVSAEMKAFMDATGGLWFHGKLTGKKFAAFASAGNTEGGADLCLQALHTYGKYMGMWCAALPVKTLPGENTNALGIIQYSSGRYAEKLDDKTRRAITAAVVFLNC